MTLLLSIALATGCPKAPTAPVAQPLAKPKIVVALVVDHLSSWLLNERLSALPKDGGFARLAREGTYVVAAVHTHANTDTAPGHAALFTGLSPRETGIVANELIDARGYVSVLRDADTRLVDASGVTDGHGSSIARARVDTVADRVGAAASIVSLSLKDRGAIFGGGRHPTATIWFDPGLDRFVTSTAFAPALPAWALPHATHDAISALRKDPWVPLDPVWLKAHAQTPDDQPGEGDWEGLGTTFPHSLATSKHPGYPFRATPFGDEAVLALSTAAIIARDPNRPMLLSISLSSNDYILHVFGPESWESWDSILRLDRNLGRLFEVLDRAVTPEGWSAILAADHGGPRKLPERAAQTEARVSPEALAASLEVMAESVLGPGKWVYGVADPMVFFTEAAHALPIDKRRLLEDTLATNLRADPRFSAVFVNRTLPADCATEKADLATPLADLVCRSASPATLGDLFIVARPGIFFDTRIVVGKGLNHGSPYPDDRTIPILARAPGRIGAGRRIDRVLTASTYTRTLASLLGLSFGNEGAGEDLTH